MVRKSCDVSLLIWCILDYGQHHLVDFWEKFPTDMDFIWIEKNSYDSGVLFQTVWSCTSICKPKSFLREGWYSNWYLCNLLNYILSFIGNHGMCTLNLVWGKFNKQLPRYIFELFGPPNQHHVDKRSKLKEDIYLIGLELTTHPLHLVYAVFRRPFDDSFYWSHTDSAICFGLFKSKRLAKPPKTYNGPNKFNFKAPNQILNSYAVFLLQFYQILRKLDRDKSETKTISF